MTNSDSQLVLDAIRRIVKDLRNFSKLTEKNYGLSTAQIFVLQKLKEAKTPLTVNQLASATLTHQSSVSVVVSKLVNRDLVERIQNENDHRSSKIRITTAGKYLLSKSPPSVQERLTKAITRMSPSEQKGLVIGLRSLMVNAGMQDDEAPMLMED